MTELELKELLKGKNVDELFDLLIVGLEATKDEDNIDLNEILKINEHIA
ncbi:hypothetical protein [uncultured Cetobacterium sp.]|nr:hypothetical protein [uncultured Cetobacterium sp.]